MDKQVWTKKVAKEHGFDFIPNSPVAGSQVKVTHRGRYVAHFKVGRLGRIYDVPFGNGKPIQQRIDIDLF